MKKKIRKISMIFALKIYFEGQFSQNFDWGSYSLWTSLRGLTSTIQLRINSFHIAQALFLEIGTKLKNVLRSSHLHPLPLNNRFLSERGIASNPKMEYQVFLCIFQKNSAMATLGLKGMGKFLWEIREKLNWDSQLGRLFSLLCLFPTFPKEFSHFLQTYIR